MINLLFISGGEILIIGLVVLLLFGAKSIPDVARMLGKGMNEFKRASDEIKRELRDQTSDIRSDIDEARSFVNKEANDMQNSLKADIEENDDSHKLKEQTKESSSDINNIDESSQSTDVKKEKKVEGDGPVSREDIIEE